MKHRLLFSFLLVVMLGTMTTNPHSISADDGEQKPSWCVSVWYPSSDDPTGYDSVLNNLDVIHEVNPFWYSPAPDGTLLKAVDAENPERLATWREAGVTIIPTIATTALSVMIEDPTIRDFHIQTIVELVETMDYDGIDIDYEGYALRTRDSFSEFMEALAEALHANNRILSMAVHAKTSDEGQWESAHAQDWARLAAAADIFKIMTYDFHNRAGESGPIGPPNWSYDVLAYAASLTDISKVRLGLHFYGYAWQRSTNVTVTTWSTVQGWVASFGLDISRDPEDMEARVDLDVQGLPKRVVYVADSIGLEYKLDLILEAFPELGGVSIWGLGGEDPANWDILRAVESDCTFFTER